MQSEDPEAVYTLSFTPYDLAKAFGLENDASSLLGDESPVTIARRNFWKLRSYNYQVERLVEQPAPGGPFMTEFFSNYGHTFVRAYILHEGEIGDASRGPDPIDVITGKEGNVQSTRTILKLIDSIAIIAACSSDPAPIICSDINPSSKKSRARLKAIVTEWLEAVEELHRLSQTTTLDSETIIMLEHLTLDLPLLQLFLDDSQCPNYFGSDEERANANLNFHACAGTEEYSCSGATKRQLTPCEEGTMMKCGKCKAVNFCGVKHQKAFWKHHRPYCFAPKWLPPKEG